MLQESACIIKTGFVVDEVSEESFYQNLLLGITKILENNYCVNNINLRRIKGLKDTDIRSWEHNNGVLLSEEMRNFYSSTNGFLFTYTFSYQNADQKVIAALGKIEVNPLENLVRTYGYETKPKAEVEKIDNKYKLSLSRESKVFELSKIDDCNKIVLVFINSYCVSSIWLFSAPYSFHFLADNFVTYFRMCIAHLGIPYWHFTVVPDGVPEWSKEIFQILAPGVLHDDRNLIQTAKHEYEDLNKIDTSIFAFHSYSETRLQNLTKSNANSPRNNTSKKKSKRSKLAPQTLKGSKRT